MRKWLVVVAVLVAGCEEAKSEADEGGDQGGGGSGGGGGSTETGEIARCRAIANCGFDDFDTCVARETAVEDYDDCYREVMTRQAACYASVSCDTYFEACTGFEPKCETAVCEGSAYCPG